MTIEETISRLKEGNNRFVLDKLDGKLQDSSRRKELTEGQQPHTIVLSCADSRVVPELAFDSGLGELFVVRVAGNIANTDSIASIEYAVAHIGSKIIIVMGHQSCGAITAASKAAANYGDNGYNLNHLLGQITPALAAAGAGAKVNDIVKKNATLTAQELVNRSGIIKDAVDKGNLKIIPAYYNLDSGKVDFL